MAREASRPPFLCSWVCQIEMKEGCQPRVSIWPLAGWGYPLPLHGAQGKQDKSRLGRLIRSGRCLFFFVEFLIARDFLEEAADHVISVYSFCLSCEVEPHAMAQDGCG